MIRINLLKPEAKEIKEGPFFPAPEFKEKKKAPVGSLILVLFIVIIVAAFFLQKRAIDNERTLLQAAQEERNSLQYVVAKLEEVEKQKANLEKKINLITDLKSKQDMAVRIMDELSKNLPEWVWLTEATYDNQTIKINGKALSNNLIADYIYNLENSPYLQNVNLIASTQRTTRSDQFLEFSLTVSYVLLGTASPPEKPSAKPKKR